MVYQDKDENGKVIKTKDGRSWYFRCRYKNEFGESKQKESKKFMTKNEAKDAESQFTLNITLNKEDDIDLSIMFIDVYNEWLHKKRSLLKCTSYYRIKKTADKHILTHFKAYRLHSIRLNTIERWKEQLLSKGLTIDYCNKIIGMIQEIFEIAKENYDYSKKICSRIYKEHVTVSNKKLRDAEWNYWTFNEFQKFIPNVDNEYYYTMFNLLYYTGLRIGELIALTWEDINFERKLIRIRSSFSCKIEGGGFIITDPKTANSIREIDIDDQTREILKKHYLKEQNIYNFDKSMFVFGNVKHASETTIRNNLNKFIKKCERQKRITPHGFRHSHASFLINLGLDVRDVAARLGDTPEVIEKTYYHMFPEKKSLTVQAINNYLKTD